MAATNTTRNKIRNMKNVLFWIAQQPHVLSGKCPHCKKPLVKDIGDVYELTMDHLSDSYDHSKRKETSKAKGGAMMHSACHKAKTINEKINNKR